MLTVRQRYRRTDRQTDRRTDGRTTYDSNTALALRASRGKKYALYTVQAALLIYYLLLKNYHQSCEVITIKKQPTKYEMCNTKFIRTSQECQ